MQPKSIKERVEDLENALPDYYRILLKKINKLEERITILEKQLSPQDD